MQLAMKFVSVCKTDDARASDRQASETASAERSGIDIEGEHLCAGN